MATPSTLPERPLAAAGPVIAPESERRHLAALARVLEEHDGIGPTVVAPDGGTVPIPSIANQLFQEVTRLLAAGDAVSVTAAPQTFAVAEAVEFLDEPEASIRAWIDDGRLPILSDDPPRFALSDLLVLRAERHAERRSALEDLIRFNQSIGLYDR